MKYETKLIDGKMMLISRDIKVGESYRTKSETFFKTCFKKTEGKGDIYFPKETIIWWKDDSNGGMLTWNPLSECFKIIGEISPGATWLKEGRIIPEEKIQVLFVDYVMAGRTFTLEQGKTFYGNSPHKAPIKLRIKGPCGHFH